MSKSRTDRRAEAARNIVSHLAASEMAVEDAVEIIGAFASDLPKLRAASSLSTTFGHDIYVEVAAAMNAAVLMRGCLVRAHNLLEEARVDLRLPAMMVVPGSDKPPTPGPAFARVAAAG